MTLAEYQTLTGTTVPDSDATRMKAVIRRAESKLESLLGYSLSRQKSWTELGKTQYSGLEPFPSLPVSDDVIASLSAPDEQTGTIQLFNFDELDTYIKINPAKQVFRAKVVMPVSDDEFITFYDLDSAAPYLNNAGLVTAIARYSTWFRWFWWSSLVLDEQSNMLLAVDADYVDLCNVNRYPDIAYLLADMVTYYADSAYSLMGIMKSETIDTHSYTRASTGNSPDSMAPEGQTSSRRIIEKYAGPAVYRKLVR